MKTPRTLPGVLSVSFSAALLLGGALDAPAQIQRLLGLDISDWQGNISQQTWNDFITVTNRKFVILRASRGGTTGFYDENDSGNTKGKNTLSQRYDDFAYIQNINRATTAGLFAGSYHFSRPDITNAPANTGTNEAAHFIEMAGPWMRPGYLMPVHDLEAGDGKRTANQMAQFCIDFSNWIYTNMGIRPAIYINGNYCANVLNASQSLKDQLAKPPPNLPTNAVPSVVSPCYPYLWVARWPNQTDPYSIDVQNTEPKDTYSGFYGAWDDYGVAQPWKFWQYASTYKMQIFKNGTANLDVDVVHGGTNFLKDQLIPALWMNNSSGDWGTLANWNSGQTPVQPVQGPNQTNALATGPLPTPRLPGEVATPEVTSGVHDTVILERPNANITVTLSSGSYNIRKLYMRETLNITGGSLTINYVPSPDSTTFGAQFSGPVTLSGSGSLSVHTLQVDSNRTFTVNGGSLAFNTINLMPGSVPATLFLGGNVNIAAFSGSSASFSNGVGSGSSGRIDLGGDTRTMTVASGIDLFIEVPVANGGVNKSGPGTMHLDTANTYSGGTTISNGTLDAGVAGSLPGNVTNTAGTLRLGTPSAMAAGATLVLASSPAPGAVNLSFSGTNTINALYFGNVQQAAGTWAAAGAAHNDPAFTGAGVLNVISGPGPSSTALTCTSGANPSIYGDSLTFTATVTGSPGTPTGTVTFKDGVAVLGTATLNGSAEGTFTTNKLSVSGFPHFLRAVYNGDSNFNPSTSSPLLQTVAQKPLTVTGVTAQSKFYDETTTATIHTDSAALVGVLSGDTVTLNTAGATGAFADAAVGMGKTVNISGLAKGGADALNYSLTPPTATADIRPATPPHLLAGPTYNALSGAFSVTFQGYPDYQYRIDVSDAVSGPWAFLTTVRAGTDGTFEVGDTILPRPQTRFYRTSYP